MLPKVILVTPLLLTSVFAMPPNDKALSNDAPEARIHKRPRPCRGRSASEGRTFFDWSLQYVNYNENYNYNINCGGGGGGGQYGGGGQHGGGGSGGPQKPVLSGLLQGIGNQPSDNGGVSGGNGPVTFIQQQVQGIFANGGGPGGSGSFVPQDGIFGNQGLGSFLQGGLFNGQGVLSLFENGLFSGIFDNRPSNTHPPSNVPSRPIITTTTTPKPTGGDPDDIIYNDEKPVHEDHDAVFPDTYNRPGQYLVASNPVFGNFVHDLSGRGNNNRRIHRQFNREINRLVRPLENLFGI